MLRSWQLGEGCQCVNILWEDLHVAHPCQLNMNPNGQENVYWVLPHYMAVNCFNNYHQVVAQNYELR